MEDPKFVECTKKLSAKLTSIAERHFSGSIVGEMLTLIRAWILGLEPPPTRVRPFTDAFVKSARILEGYRYVLGPFMAPYYAARCCKLKAGGGSDCDKILERLWEGGAYECPPLLYYVMELLEQGRSLEAQLIARNPWAYVEKWMSEGRCWPTSQKQAPRGEAP